MREARLISLKPLAPGTSEQRVMLVTPELMATLDGPWQSNDDADRIARLRAHLDHFVSGGFIDPGYLKQLTPKTDEVWTIRSKRPRPSIRVLGRFAARNVFVATNYELRGSLNEIGSIEWGRATRHCKAVWRALFEPYPPMPGETINDYVSNAANPKLFK